MSTTAVVERLHELLAPRGFERQKRTWNRKSHTFVDVIDVQVSKAGDAVTVNTGVLDPDVYKGCWGTDPPAFVDEPSSTVRARVGQLMGDRDVWWPISEAETPESVVEAVAANALTFVERMHSREAMVEFLMASGVLRQKYPPPIIYLAILRNDLGDNLGACSVLDELRKTARGAWRARVIEVSVRLGCS